MCMDLSNPKLVAGMNALFWIYKFTMLKISRNSVLIDFRIRMLEEFGTYKSCWNNLDAVLNPFNMYRM